jgi:hypothetical protein
VILFLGLLFCFISLMSAFVAVPCCFCYYGSVVLFEVWNYDTSSVILFIQDVRGLLFLPMNIRIDLSISSKTLELWCAICRLLSVM